MKTKLMVFLAVSFCAQTALAQGGAVIVRVDDPFGSHCIDATTEAITVHVRRVFTQKEEISLPRISVPV